MPVSRTRFEKSIQLLLCKVVDTRRAELLLPRAARRRIATAGFMEKNSPRVFNKLVNCKKLCNFLCILRKVEMSCEIRPLLFSNVYFIL